MSTSLLNRLALAGRALALSACSSMMPATELPSQAAPQWQAPLPHQGDLVQLRDWWQAQGKPLLVRLIDAAQRQSPSVAQALSRIAQAHAAQAGANAALRPQPNAAASLQRSAGQPGVAAASVTSIGLQARWELDLAGANRALDQAALAQLQGSQALWHNAQVSVAAEVARNDYSLANCQQLLALARQDAQSRRETARVSDISSRAGLLAPALSALVLASAAEAANRVTSQQETCDMGTKALVALTGLDEADLRQQLARARAQARARASPSRTMTLAVASVPAQALAQRPDVFAAERELVVARAQAGSAKAQRRPRLSLNGAIGVARFDGCGLETWSFGPLALSLPLVDGGQQVTQVTLAQTQHAQAVLTCRGQVRQAVREVEEALLRLNSSAARQDQTELAQQGCAQSSVATQLRHQHGLASLLELEEARRVALAADSGLLDLALERELAWVALYRALGGGWDRSAAEPALPAPS